VGFFSTANAGIVGSSHDFSGSGWSQGEICLPCHTPHHANADAGGPLWNHALSTQTYTADAETVTLDSNSQLCMGCHDGTVALDSFGGKSGTTFIGNNKYNIGTDLSDDHPVGSAAVYPDATYMAPKTTFSSHFMPLRQVDGQDVVGCTTCHEPHNRNNTDHMLWVSQTGTVTTFNGDVPGSGLCLTCHKK
jgi:hypothetical protein